MMRTRITRPSLAGLWRVLLALLENVGAENASELARSLAVAGFTGRTAEASGVRIERRGHDVHIHSLDEPMGSVRTDLPRTTRARRRCATHDRLLLSR